MEWTIQSSRPKWCTRHLCLCLQIEPLISKSSVISLIRLLYLPFLLLYLALEIYFRAQKSIKFIVISYDGYDFLSISLKCSCKICLLLAPMARFHWNRSLLFGCFAPMERRASVSRKDCFGDGAPNHFQTSWVSSCLDLSFWSPSLFFLLKIKRAFRLDWVLSMIFLSSWNFLMKWWNPRCFEK